jgi:hypothetical protein
MRLTIAIGLSGAYIPYTIWEKTSVWYVSRSSSAGALIVRDFDEVGIERIAMVMIDMKNCWT